MNLFMFFATAEEAVTESSGGDLLGALGIDGKLLILQTLAFLVMVWVLAKFVYPYLIKAIENRRETIEDGVKNAKKAEEQLKNVEHKVADIIRSARKEADAMVATGQKEAATIVEAAEEKAIKRAEHIVAEASAQMSNELSAAREALKKETAQLVASATEQVIKQKVDAKSDAQLIAGALKEVK